MNIAAGRSDRRWLGCPICRRDVKPSDLLSANGLDAEVVTLAAVNTPGWIVDMGLCADCVRRFTAARDYLKRHDPALAGAFPILPTTVRLGALETYRGRGVTIAFLDSGFYAHPDLVEPNDRILRYVDLMRVRSRREELDQPSPSSWHGMMTSVVACGNGRLSGGFYRGLASEAKLVLLKVGNQSRITHDDIQRGLEWVTSNKRRYGIRIVNVSCGGDYEASYLEDGLSQAAEKATQEGILVCAAVGNQGHAPGHPVLPPASAPSVLTVGGLDDKNRLSFGGYDMYNSSYGPTVDGLQKPEVIAPGIWVAAPILPGTPTADQAKLLTRLERASDADLPTLLEQNPGVDSDLDAAATLAAPLVRRLIQAKARDNAVISGAYKHVDGTSFAAPIVASIAAQMIEANPRLSPMQIKSILIATARRIPHVDVDRQGWGVVDPERALDGALQARERPGRRAVVRWRLPWPKAPAKP